MKNRIIHLAVVAIAVLFIPALAGCGSGAGDGNTNGNTVAEIDTPLPTSIGANELGGKVRYDTDEIAGKIEFSSTVPANTSGTYVVYRQIWNGNMPILDNNNKFTYDAAETGFYSWNENTDTVTLKPEKINVWLIFRTVSGLKTRSEMKPYLVASASTMSAAEKAEMLYEMGVSSMEDAITLSLNEEYANRTYDYSFSTDASNALFMQETLPVSIGSNVLILRSWYDQVNGVYSFNENRTYTHTASNPADNHAGRYTYNNQRKRVYLKPLTIGGLSNDQYYAASLPIAQDYINYYYSGINPYPDLNKAVEAYTNNAFRMRYEHYNTKDSTLNH